MPADNTTLRYSGAGANTVSNENAEFYTKTLLSRLVPELRISKWATKPSGSNIPKNAGDTTSFRRFNSLALAKTPLVEGVTPAGSNITVDKITVTVKQYGDFVKITDYIDMMGIDPVITETVAVQGEQAAQTTDSIVADEIFAGTNVYRAGAVASRNLIATTITETDIKNTVAVLKKANVKPLANGDYIALVPIKVGYDIMGLADWKAANTYRHDGLVTGAIGRLYGVQFVEIPDLYVTKYVGAGAASADVYASLFMGKDYFGMVDVEGSAKPKVIVKAPNDPLDQVSTCGWKNLFAVKRLNEACGVRLETK